MPVPEVLGDEVALRIERARHGFSHRVRSAHTWIVSAASAQEVIERLGTEGRLLITSTLGGRPIRCSDLRRAGREARLDDALLVVDNSLATSFGCPACQLGAHVSVEELDRVMGQHACGMAAVGVSRDVRAICRGIWERIDSFPRPKEEDLLRLAARLDDFEGRFRQENDVAQVVAFYLACHPGVSSISYPGLPRDSTFGVASRTLRNGFGPIVDFRLDGVGLEDVVRLVDGAREGFLGLDAADGHETSLVPLGSLGLGERTWFLRLRVGPCDPKEVVDVLEGVLPRRIKG